MRSAAKARIPRGLRQFAGTALRAAAAAALLLTAACRHTGAEAWVHADPMRVLAADSATCEVAATGSSIQRRGGTPRSEEERQVFVATVRRAYTECMRSGGWTQGAAPRSAASSRP
jgi:hypothetical protein